MFERGSAGLAGIIGTLSKVPSAVARRFAERILQRALLLIRNPKMTSKFLGIVPLSHRHGNCIPFAAIRWPDFEIGPRLEGHSVILFAIQTYLSCGILLTVDALGLSRGGSSSQFIDPPQDFPKRVPRHGNLCQLEHNVSAMANNFGPDLHQFLPQRGQRPGLYLLRQGQRPHEVAEIVGQGVKLESEGTVAKRTA